MTPGTLLQGFRARWAGRKDTWNAFAGIPCQVNGREMPPGTLLQENRSRSTAGHTVAEAGIGSREGKGPAVREGPVERHSMSLSSRMILA